MENLDGMLLVPPDRGQILGRAVWKARYVVVGRRNIAQCNSNPSYSQLVSSSRNNSITPKPLTKAPTDECCLFIYKHKEDAEPSQQWPISSISDCQVQMVTHRKQGPVLPTLVVTISDKERKRRSSRAAGLISSSKEPSATSLWFRTPPDDHHPSLHDWARSILSKKTPMSPESPMSPQFTNPFAPRSRENTDYFSRPTSGNQSGRPDTRPLQHKSSANTHSTGTVPRDRPLTFSSESPSLRSKRSDVSSPSSSNYPIQHAAYPIPGQHYTTVLPTDLPSPINTTGEYQGEFIEGWTSAQGRSSTMSSPIRGRDSISSQTPQPSITATEASSPPGPRETILDRAFQMRCIPGSEREVPGEEHLSSLARFEALMREADEKRKQREAAERAEQLAMRSAFEASDSSDEDDDVDSDVSDEDAYGHIPDRRGPAIPPTTQRALRFIAGRHESDQSQSSVRPPVFRTPVNNMRTEAVNSPSQAPLVRPHTAHAKSHPHANSRTQSTPQLAAAMGNMEITSSNASEDAPTRSNADKRLSTASVKRLSFTEFTKRLSSTSSLLLVQTNASGGSSRGSSEIDIQPSSVPRGTLNPRGAGLPPRDRDRDESDRRCGWRNSVGVIGHESGFL